MVICLFKIVAVFYYYPQYGQVWLLEFGGKCTNVPIFQRCNQCDNVSSHSEIYLNQDDHDDDGEGGGRGHVIESRFFIGVEIVTK